MFHASGIASIIGASHIAANPDNITATLTLPDGKNTGFHHTDKHCRRILHCLLLCTGVGSNRHIHSCNSNNQWNIQFHGNLPLPGPINEEKQVSL